MMGIDVGGANLKVVDESGAHIHYCPLWENAPITDILLPYAGRTGGSAAVVMSGELADCFSNKLQGISFIVKAVQQAFPRARFYGMDAAFHTDAVPALAAANWLASADYLRELHPRAVLLDIGSTTADIIPLNYFDELKGLTDTRRLQKGYLLYTGMLRTSIPTLLTAVDLDGIRTPVSTEYFATSADAHLVLGHITPGQYSCDTPDRKEKTPAASLRRLARVVCADLEEIGENGAVKVAEAFWEIQRGHCGRYRSPALCPGAGRDRPHPQTRACGRCITCPRSPRGGIAGENSLIPSALLVTGEEIADANSGNFQLCNHLYQLSGCC
jgi:probable H4MPT-linked C1 transfer pathway protein